MTASMEVRVEPGPGEAPTVLVSGEIDLSNIDRFRAALDEDSPSLVVDLSGVTYIDSAGVAVLFSRAARGPLEIWYEEQSVVRALIEVTRLGDVAVTRRK